MKFKIPGLFLLAIVLTGVFVDSCKKTQSYVPTLLTASPWVLASVQTLRYTGSTLTETDTLNTKCLLPQTFTFKTDNTCNYQNFICRQGTVSGTWQFSDDKLTLFSTIITKDTVDGGRDTTDAPFKNAQIVNLGSYSLILQTGDINSYYTSGTKRVIKRYGFIHQ